MRGDWQRNTQVARLFHEHYERLAPEYGYETKEESQVDFDDLEVNHRRLMIATVGGGTRGSAVHPARPT